MAQRDVPISRILAGVVVIGLLAAVGAQQPQPQTSQYYNPNMLQSFNQELIGPGGQPVQQQQQQEPVIYVKVGTKIFDAVEPHVLLYYNVDIIPIRASQFDPKEYFDDGINGGDEVPNDGMPSKITIDYIHYMSIYSARNRDRISAFKQEMVKDGPVKFFRLPAVTLDAYVAATLRAPEQQEERKKLQEFSASYWKDHISSKVEDIDNQQLLRYEGYEVFQIVDGGQVYFDTTRTPMEVDDILDGRMKQREESLMRRDLQRDQVAQKLEQRYQGTKSPTDTYMRKALEAAGTANQQISGMQGGTQNLQQTQPGMQERTGRRSRGGGGGRSRAQRQPRQSGTTGNNQGFNYGGYSGGM